MGWSCGVLWKGLWDQERVVELLGWRKLGGSWSRQGDWVWIWRVLLLMTWVPMGRGAQGLLAGLAGREEGGSCWAAAPAMHDDHGAAPQQQRDGTLPMRTATTLLVEAMWPPWGAR